MKNLKITVDSKELNGNKKKKIKKVPKPKQRQKAETKKGELKDAQHVERQNRIQELSKIQNKKSKKSKAGGLIKKLFILVLIIGIAFLGYTFYKRWDRLQKFNSSITTNTPTAKVCDSIINPKCWTEAFSPKLEQYNATTGVLIVGLDTREEGGVNQGLQNTDSIMVALYNHNTKKTTLISLPRDLYVPYKINGKGNYHAKINSLYATGEKRSDVKDGFDLLEENVERIVGQKIQYRVVIKLKGVEDAVNAVGGVDIEVPAYIKAEYPNDYPGKNGKPNTPWLTYEFKPGVQHMDGEHALVWARFRHVQNTAAYDYASDFSRGERQQQVLDAIKEKALNDNGSTLDKAEKYWDIFQTVNKNVSANIGLEEIFAGFSIAQEADRDPVNVVMDPNFGGLNQIIYHPPTTETGGYQIRFKDESFKTAHNYLKLIWEYPKLYDENAKILVENHLGRTYVATDKSIKFRNDIYGSKLPVTISQLTMTTGTKGQPTGVIIVDMTKGKKAGTTKYLAEYFGATQIIEDPQNYGYKQSGYKEDIKVIVNPAP